CPKCQFENPEGIKFCGECSAKLERSCPNCQFTNLKGSQRRSCPRETGLKVNASKSQLCFATWRALPTH
ncbi:zinc ribbon domain-containing protein, partial [bacterium]|nr:zinc ribbon domain-containing protein [bacterium]